MSIVQLWGERGYIGCAFRRKQDIIDSSLTIYPKSSLTYCFALRSRVIGIKKKLRK